MVAVVFIMVYLWGFAATMIFAEFPNPPILCLPNVTHLTSTFVLPLAGTGLVSRFYSDVYLPQCDYIKTGQTIAVLSGELLNLLLYSCSFSIVNH